MLSFCCFCHFVLLSLSLLPLPSLLSHHFVTTVVISIRLPLFCFVIISLLPPLSLSYLPLPLSSMPFCHYHCCLLPSSSLSIYLCHHCLPSFCSHHHVATTAIISIVLTLSLLSLSLSLLSSSLLFCCCHHCLCHCLIVHFHHLAAAIIILPPLPLSPSLCYCHSHLYCFSMPSLSPSLIAVILSNIILAQRVLNLPVLQKIVSSTAAMGSAHRLLSKSHDDHDNLDGWPYPHHCA